LNGGVTACDEAGNRGRAFGVSAMPEGRRHGGERVIEDERQDWRQELRARGYRLTPQRQLVLEAVATLEHGTPDEICAEVRKTASGVNISTVYRSLELLEELGLVTHTHLGHGSARYHTATDSDHLHLVCRDCGGVTETDVSVASELVDRLLGEHGFDTDVRHFSVFGRCRECSA
jgi:Fur family transcriptional regulator, ferric uptake regulator